MYTSIANVVQQFYSISYLIVTFTTIVFAIVFVLLSYFALQSVRKYGLRNAYVIASFCSALGAAIKCFGPRKDDFYIIILGQLIVAIGKCFVSTTTPILAGVWFKSDESATVIGVDVGCQMLTTMVTFWLPSMILKHDEEQISTSLKVMSMIVAFSTSICFILIVIFMQEKPKLPPTILQKRKIEQIEKLPLKALLKNRDYILFSLSVIVTYTFDSTLSVLLNQILMSTFQNGELIETIVGTLLMGLGFVGSICIPVILDKFKKFKLTTYLIFSLAVVLFSFIHACIWLRKEFLLYVSVALFGFFFYCRYAVLVDIIAEVTYPYPQNTVFGILAFTVSVLVSMFIPALSWLIHYFGTNSAFFVLNLLLLSSFILIINAKWNLKRKDEENPILIAEIYDIQNEEIVNHT
ncbi:hypothetical protein B4U79_16396 [Dinothrombium tinctorium]|uniref:Major facilitator superfamily (MFS) profile domain-containing protein n=1 Tax=Dinothrombium tinctorium TaxID=1965070 RepID=A0A3S3NZ00_9ACAR|nr:hypothetical protein B4U79_16687 [Dinothrombium tinctorium]RWS01776.1 hypothetical protein B4U79_16686 [Dinothrombium tinctorium]RWS04624.1 hypothetical protein B4U79_16396 [Dinothrombium tinctorium]